MSSSILEMTATNDEVAENVGELAASVRETVCSIEEMAYSIKEVAKNVDALSLTAEETSSLDERDGRLDRPGAVERQRDGAPLRGGRARRREGRRGHPEDDRRDLPHQGELARRPWPSSRTSASRIEAIGQILERHRRRRRADEPARAERRHHRRAGRRARQGLRRRRRRDQGSRRARRRAAPRRSPTSSRRSRPSRKNAITAVERGAHNVDRGVEVSNEAERALKKILESSQKIDEHGARHRARHGRAGQGLEAGHRRHRPHRRDGAADRRRHRASRRAARSSS